MTDIKSRILEEAESAGINVIAIADAMEKCPTLAELICNSNIIADGVSIRYISPKEAYAQWDEVTRKELNERFDDE